MTFNLIPIPSNRKWLHLNSVTDLLVGILVPPASLVFEYFYVIELWIQDKLWTISLDSLIFKTKVKYSTHQINKNSFQ